MWMEENNKII